MPTGGGEQVFGFGRYFGGDYKRSKPPSRRSSEGGLGTILGGGLLSHDMDRSIIGDGELNYRVRNGVGCTLSSMATKEISIKLYN